MPLKWKWPKYSKILKNDQNTPNLIITKIPQNPKKFQNTPKYGAEDFAAHAFAWGDQRVSCSADGWCGVGDFWWFGCGGGVGVVIMAVWSGCGSLSC